MRYRLSVQGVNNLVYQYNIWDVSIWMEEFRKAQAEVEQKKEKPMSQKLFKVI